MAAAAAQPEEKFPYAHSIVEGLVVPPFMTPEKFENVCNAPAHEGDVFIATYPKSGTTWMQGILRLLLNMDTTATLQSLMPWIETAPESVLSDTIETRPRVFKTHLPVNLVGKLGGGGSAAAAAAPAGELRDNAKYIYVARNGKDVAASLFHHSLGFKAFNYDGPWDDFFGKFRAGRVEFGSWLDHVLGWWGVRDKPNVLFLTYEDLQLDAHAQVRRIAEFLGMDQTEEQISAVVEGSSFRKMKQDPTANFDWTKEHQNPGFTFMRKGIIGDGDNHFSEEQKQAYAEWTQAALNDAGLKFSEAPAGAAAAGDAAPAAAAAAAAAEVPARKPRANVMPGPSHMNVYGTHRMTCDGCNACPIEGFRMKCIVCPDHDLCETCFNLFLGGTLPHVNKRNKISTDVSGHAFKPFFESKSFTGVAGAAKNQPKVKAKKVKPNAKCPCGSGKKFKKCCANK